jgi:hypothetical protein
MQQGVDRFLEASMDRLAPIRRARDEMTTLRARLEELEGSLRRLEVEGRATAPQARTAKKKTTARKKTTAGKKPAGSASDSTT